jgi:hypothetical protein
MWFFKKKSSKYFNTHSVSPAKNQTHQLKNLSNINRNPKIKTTETHSVFQPKIISGYVKRASNLVGNNKRNQPKPQGLAVTSRGRKNFIFSIIKLMLINLTHVYNNGSLILRVARNLNQISHTRKNIKKDQNWENERGMKLEVLNELPAVKRGELIPSFSLGSALSLSLSRARSPLSLGLFLDWEPGTKRRRRGRGEGGEKKKGEKRMRELLCENLSLPL